MAAQEGIITGIWWDMNSCQYPLHIIHPLTSHLLSRFSIPFPANLFSCTAYVCHSQVNPELELRIHNAGFSLSKLTPGEIQNLDKMLLTDLMLWAMDNSPVANIVLLTGNIQSFAYTLTKLHERKFRIFVCSNNINQTSIPHYCHSHLLWPHFLLSLLQYTTNASPVFPTNDSCKTKSNDIPKNNDKPKNSYAGERAAKKMQMSSKAITMKEFKTWFIGTVHCKQLREKGYDISALVKDCKKSTGKDMDLESLGCSKISELVQQCSDHVVVRQVKPGLNMAFPADAAQAKKRRRNRGGRLKTKASSEEFNKFMHKMLADGYFSEGLPLDRLVDIFGERSGGLLVDHKLLGFNKLSSLVSSLPFVCIKRIGKKTNQAVVFPSLNEDYCSHRNDSETSSSCGVGEYESPTDNILSFWRLGLVNKPSYP